VSQICALPLLLVLKGLLHATRHPLSEKYGLALTVFAAWRVDISQTVGVSGRNLPK